MPEGLSGRTRLLLTTDSVGGVWRYTLELARGMSDRSIECVVAVLGPAPDQEQRREAAAVRGLNLVQTGLPLDWTADGPATLADTSARLATLAALTGVSGVHLHAPALVGMARWPVPVVAVAHSCVGTWWRAMRGDEPAPPDFRWRIEATREGLGRAAAVISPTAAHAEALRAVYGALDLIVVYNGADPLPLPAVRRDRAVLTAGRLWDEAKGVALLDRAAPALDGPVRAAGSVEGPNGARAALSRCELLGILDAAGMARAYAGATVFASMSRYEPFGLAVLEAAQAGLRLVLADIPTFRELWDGVATFVPDEAGLPAALQAALNAGPDERPRQRAGRYTLDATVDATLTVHRRLLPARVAVGQVGG